ncbi:FAD-dependent oxidoreductase [Pseudoalteromonas sp. OANN1]|uniref:NAD(P)/FAD-dependent oxidoreductase n=1 Tax=Pseudoalteromonas sp. OANN1 TaxID=2954497 RepID=UPI0020986758|nr:FAD-dependent oxidoreductase [Pseudoalteromonas sp. OANN1]MCO7200160.1 FAD-binding oxidoreductase [Pseudoalteromonas sp. OANN1]
MSGFDPLTQPHCQGQAFANSYWAATCPLGTPNPSLDKPLQVDIAVIGGGFTGLLTAYHLATTHHQSVALFEANQVGFGASARNAGFVLPSTGRLGYAQLAKKYGLDVSKSIYQEYNNAVALVREHIDGNHIDCNVQASGYLKVAHNQQAFSLLKAQSEFLTATLGSKSHQLLSRQQLTETYMHNQQGFGALRFDNAFGVHPLKLLLGYKALAQQAGVQLYENSLVTRHQNQNGNHQLEVNGHKVSANKVVIAANAYAQRQFSPLTQGRYLPILSSIIVTEPLSDEQLAANGLITEQVVMDTRRLKYYYRRLPDNRILFGGRGAVFGHDQDNAKYQYNLRSALNDCFPKLDVKVDYFWSGYIAAALDDLPHIYSENNTGYVLGYCGSGVAFSAQASIRLAEKLMGLKVPNLPIYTKPLPKFPMPRLRRVGQLAYYQYAQLMDKFA